MPTNADPVSGVLSGDSRRAQLEDALLRRILVLDGAMGTLLQARRPTTADYGGPGLEGCHEHLCLTHPERILDVHRAYLAAGADMIETNSFQGSPIALAERGLAGHTRALNLTAARLARQAAGEYSSASKPRFVAGAIGPVARSLALARGVTSGEMSDGYYIQASGLVDGGVDVLLVETAFDTRDLEAALVAIERLERERAARIPLMVSATVESLGTMLGGRTVEAFHRSVVRANLLSIGLNCSTGPGSMTSQIRTLARVATTRVSCHPNAGLPDHEDRYPQTPELLASQLEQFVDRGWLNIVGGCCGTTPAHIRAIAQMVEGRAPRIVGRARMAGHGA